MAREAEELPVRASILDRLIDDDPASQTDPHVTPRREMKQLQLAIRRDLNDMLNTRQRCLSTPAELKELCDTILNYGLPDLAGLNLAAYEDKDVVLRAVDQAVRRFEPRFKSVAVKHNDGPGEQRTLRFEIDASVHADPEPERVVFDSQVDPVLRNVDVRPSQ